MKDEALKLALDALDNLLYWDNGKSDYDQAREAITAIKQALAAPVQDSTCSNALREQGKAYPRTCKKCGKGPCVELANAALDKMAENARELGLDYEPAPVQEPFGYLEIDDIESQREYPHNCRNVNLWHEGGQGMAAIYTTPPAQPAPVQEPVGTYGEIFESMLSLLRTGLQRDQQIYMEMKDKPLYTAPPTAQRQWVGLTDDEILEAAGIDGADTWIFETAYAIEAKLKEKNA